MLIFLECSVMFAAEVVLVVANNPSLLFFGIESAWLYSWRLRNLQNNRHLESLCVLTRLGLHLLLPHNVKDVLLQLLVINDKDDIRIEVNYSFDKRFCLGPVLWSKPINNTARRIQGWEYWRYDFLKRLDRSLCVGVMGLNQ